MKLLIKNKQSAIEPKNNTVFPFGDDIILYEDNIYYLIHYDRKTKKIKKDILDENKAHYLIGLK